MSSINDAIFKGRNRRVMPTPPDSLRPPQQSALTKQFMARKAVEAVLAGGYTKAEPKGPRHSLPQAPAPAQSEIRGYGRAAMMWVSIFGVAGLIGIASSHLPGHAVHARQAGQASVVNTAEVAEAALEELAEPPVIEPPVVEPATETAAPDAAASAPAPMVVAQAAPSLQVPLLRAQLRPVAKLPGMAADDEMFAGDAQPFEDDQSPLGSRAVAPAGQPGMPALEEVLYEGEPAQSARVSGPRAMAYGRSDAEPERSSSRSASAGRRSVSRSSSSGGMQVEGIFWDKVRPMAIIAGNIVEVGGQVGAYKVAVIEPGRVILSGLGRSLELRP